jgi:hypothetical protein
MDAGHKLSMKRYDVDESAAAQRAVKELRSAFESVKAQTRALAIKKWFTY